MTNRSAPKKLSSGIGQRSECRSSVTNCERKNGASAALKSG
jgi:hypothetical protein